MLPICWSRFPAPGTIWLTAACAFTKAPRPLTRPGSTLRSCRNRSVTFMGSRLQCSQNLVGQTVLGEGHPDPEGRRYAPLHEGAPAVEVESDEQGVSNAAETGGPVAGREVAKG